MVKVNNVEAPLYGRRGKVVGNLGGESRGYKHGQKELVLAEVNTISLN